MTALAGVVAGTHPADSIVAASLVADGQEGFLDWKPYPSGTLEFEGIYGGRMVKYDFG